MWYNNSNMMKKEIIEKKSMSNKLASAIRLLEEKVSIEFDLPLDEVKKKSIIISGGELKFNK